MVDPARSATARKAAERALVRVARAYGGTPEFVLLGGLVPELLCSPAAWRHAGTTDVDVQVDLEIASASVNARRLERALEDAGFVPDSERVWRWTERSSADVQVGTEVRFELLSDLEDHPANTTVQFDDTTSLGAANLRGTGFAARDAEVRAFSDQGSADDSSAVLVRVSGLAGFLLAKTAAAYGRAKDKDWYDIAFVLLHNDHTSSPEGAASSVVERFGGCPPDLRTAMMELQANNGARPVDRFGSRQPVAGPD